MTPAQAAAQQAAAEAFWLPVILGGFAAIGVMVACAAVWRIRQAVRAATTPTSMPTPDPDVVYDWAAETDWALWTREMEGSQ